MIGWSLRSSKCTANCVEQPLTEKTAIEVSEKLLLSYEEVERLRSLIVGGVPELKSFNTRERVSYGFQSACNVLDFLGVECNPVSVYRLGRLDQGRNRLLKVVLPARVFHCFVVVPAPRLRFLPEESFFLGGHQLQNKGSGDDMNATLVVWVSLVHCHLTLLGWAVHSTSYFAHDSFQFLFR